VWNAGYDGRFVPNVYSLDLLKNLRRRNRSILGVGGQDLHEIAEDPHVQVVVSCPELSQASIMRALKEGTFVAGNAYFQIDARCSPGPLKLAQITVARRMYDSARRIRDAWTKSFRRPACSNRLKQ